MNPEQKYKTAYLNVKAIVFQTLMELDKAQITGNKDIPDIATQRATMNKMLWVMSSLEHKLDIPPDEAPDSLII